MNRKIGVNGFGRVGKLLVWNLIASESYSEIVVNTGTPNIGEPPISMPLIANYLEKDSTYGRLSDYLKRSTNSGFDMKLNEGEPEILIFLKRLAGSDSDIRTDDEEPECKLTFITEKTKPQDIPWKACGIKLVVDATGMFLHPYADESAASGSLRGHLEAGAEMVVVTAPFQLGETEDQPQDCITTIAGINQNVFDSRSHKIISIASCTTTCLAHMVKPLFQKYGHKQILSISMVTVHALTSAQPALDLIPDGRHSNERFYRSAINNIILTSTGATKSLRLVLPEMEKIGFITQSVRVPVSTGSLIIMTVNIQDKIDRKDRIKRQEINDIYEQEAKLAGSCIAYSEKPHVSEDIKGLNKAVLIEGCETHTRTADATIETDSLHAEGSVGCKDNSIRIPITQATIYGWYDNEMGNFVDMLSKNLDHIFERTPFLD